MRRLKMLFLLLGILGLVLVADLAARAGASDPASAPGCMQGKSACPVPSDGLVMDRESLQAEAVPSEFTSTEKPVTFDCGIGETWRHYVP